MSTLAEVLDQFDLGEAREGLLQALYAREDEACDGLRMAGVQFGLFPAIVAKVLTDLGLGTPVPDEVKAMIDNEFAATMAEIRRQWEQGGGGQT
jgi:hypothetical protein